MRLILALLGAILIVYPSFGASAFGADPPNDAGTPSLSPTGRIELPDGRMLVDGVIYESRQAYFQSERYRQNGRRCGTEMPAFHSAPRGAGAQADCDFFSTTLSGVYIPTVGRYRIPVVVHVITTTAGVGALSVDTIQSQIAVLNERFLASTGPGSTAEIEFYLATQDPSGSPTNGITVSANNTWFADNGSYWTSLAWDTSRYMNIYTLNLDPQGLLGYVPGYAAQGGLVGTTADRVVVHWGAFGAIGADGPPYDQGITLVHEVGHYLGLFHTFDPEFSCGTASEPGCFSSGDLICDTNPQLFAVYTSEASCGNPNVSCSTPDPIDNYMSYSDDECLIRFTPQQIQRMRCTLLNYRPDLFTVTTTTGSMSVTPNAGVQHSGLVGGPFSQALTVYTITNPGNSAIDYEITVQDNFGLLLNGAANPISGQLGSGQNRQITVLLDTDIVNTLAAGEYMSTIIFSDLTNAVSYSRTHRLTTGELRACSSGGPISIPDASVVGAKGTINVADSGMIEDLDVNVSITHTWIGDVVVTLTHLDSGTSAVIIDQIGGSGFDTCFEFNFNNIRLDDLGTGGLIENQCVSNLTSPPSYRPENVLSVFNGLDIQGTWELKVTDMVAGDVGALTNWCIVASVTEIIEVEAPTPTSQQDTDLDTIPDATDNCPTTPNTDQADINGNGVGDACDSFSLEGCPDTITLPATSTNGATVDFQLPRTAGGFGNIQVFASPASGATFRIGTTQVMITATDATGAIATCMFDVVVTDDPTITGPVVESENCGCDNGAGGMMILPVTMLGIGALRSRSRRSRMRLP